MDDELQKLNTDCVFFLASPLTCKKGMECEYRHSEIARLNPRDCWYWLAGNCLNPSCGFRHPPLEANTGGSSGSNPPHQCSVAENNTGIPCYFYYSGFCSKGNKCTYLHSNWSAPSPSPAKPFKKGSAVKGTMLPEDEKLKQSVVMGDPTEKCRSSSQTYFKAEATVVPRCKKGLQKVPSNSGLKLSSSPEVAASEIEKATGDGFDPFSQSELVNCSSHTFKGQSLELNGQLYDHDAAEERCEPSPEFKASENGYSKYLPHEDDEYLLTFHPECSDHNSPLLYHELEEPDEYDPMHPDAGIMCKYEIYDSYSDVESAHGIDCVERVRDPLGRELPDFVLFREKNLLPVELAAEDCDSIDLQDCLKRHREIDDHPSALLFRRHGSFHLNGFRGERLEGNGLSRRLHGRLREILRRHKKPTRSLRENGHFMNGVHKQGPLRHARTHSCRQHLRGKRMTYSRLHCTNPSKNSFMRVRQNAVGSSSFAGPKTLEQIKEEKRRKVEEKTECSGMYLRKNSFADFQGPKPLTELLKNKVS